MPPAGHLGIEPPGALVLSQGGQPGPGQNGRDQAYLADRAGGEPSSGFNQTRAKAELVADPDFEVTASGQADNISRLLNVCGKRLLDE